MSARRSALARSFTGRQSRETMKREKSTCSVVHRLSPVSGWRSNSQRNACSSWAEGSRRSTRRSHPPAA